MFSPSLYRKLITKLVRRNSTYLLGMVLVRQSRKKRTKQGATYAGPPVLVEVDNFAGDIKMVVDKFSYMGGSIYWSGYHHLNEFLYLDKVLKEDMLFVDAGANQGEFTLFAAKRLNKGKVIAFEPVNTNLESLRRNITINGFKNIDVVPKGLYFENGSLPIYTSLDTEPNGGRHEGLSTLFPDEVRNVLEQTIELIPFDDNYFEHLVRFDFLKIDVEGAELNAFQGMLKSLEKFHPTILIELNADTAKSAGYSVTDIVDLLTKLGYESYTIFRGNLVKKDWSNDLQWGNFVFVHKN